jgi:hypothetical protein
MVLRLILRSMKFKGKPSENLNSLDGFLGFRSFGKDVDLSFLNGTDNNPFNKEPLQEGIDHQNRQGADKDLRCSDSSLR